MISKQEKAEIFKKFGATEKDSGGTEVQVAVLTKRITNLMPHFEKNKKDNHSKTGLMKMIGRRRRLLRYLNNTSSERYNKLIGELGLRK